MKRIPIIMAAVAALGTYALVPGAVSVSAHGTCEDIFGSGLQVHGQHVVGDYVTGLGGISGEMEWPPAGGIVGEAVQENGGAVLPGGPGPAFHFPNGFAPGASFCIDGHEEPPHSPNAEHPPAP